MVDIYYIGDDPQIADIVKEFLEQKSFQVTICTTLVQARQAFDMHAPALVLLDWNMPDGRGDSLCRWIRGSFRELPIIFLTVRGDAGDIVSGFEQGADDYVVKPFELEVLYSRITALLRRSGHTAGPYLTCGGIRIDQNRRVVTLPLPGTSCTDSLPSLERHSEIPLTATEYELLLYLMQNKGRTVTREQILAQVWDVNGNYVNNNTLTVAMKRLRDKLGSPSCIKTIRSVGYRMEDTL